MGTKNEGDWEHRSEGSDPPLNGDQRRCQDDDCDDKGDADDEGAPETLPHSGPRLKEGDIVADFLDRCRPCNVDGEQMAYERPTDVLLQNCERQDECEYAVTYQIDSGKEDQEEDEPDTVASQRG